MRWNGMQYGIKIQYNRKLNKKTFRNPLFTSCSWQKAVSIFENVQAEIWF